MNKNVCLRIDSELYEKTSKILHEKYGRSCTHFFNSAMENFIIEEKQLEELDAFELKFGNKKGDDENDEKSKKQKSNKSKKDNKNKKDSKEKS